MRQKSHRINVTFSAEEFEILSKWSEKKGESLSSLVRWIAKDCIEEEEEERLYRMIKERKKQPFSSSEEMWNFICTK